MEPSSRLELAYDILTTTKADSEELSESHRPNKKIKKKKRIPQTALFQNLGKPFMRLLGQEYKSRLTPLSAGSTAGHLDMGFCQYLAVLII